MKPSILEVPRRMNHRAANEGGDGRFQWMRIDHPCLCGLLHVLVVSVQFNSNQWIRVYPCIHSVAAVGQPGQHWSQQDEQDARAHS